MIAALCEALFLILLSTNSFAEILINEFLPNSINTDHEWIELFNNGTSSVNLSDFNISEEAANKNFTIGNAAIASNQFVVLARKEAVFNQTYKEGKYIVIEYGTAVPLLNLNDGGDSIFLYNSSGTLVSSVLKYANPGENISIGRYPDGKPSLLNLSTLTPGARNDNQAPVLNKWFNVARNNSQIGGLVNLTVNVTDDTTQVNSTIVNFNMTNFTMSKDGDLWWLRLNTTPYEQKRYNLTVFFNDSYGQSGSSILLNITVSNSPSIAGFSPAELSILIPENSTQVFNVNASDPDDSLLNYFWYINKSLISTNPLAFAYSPDFNESGVRTLNVTIMDSASNQVSMIWNLRITNLNRGPVLEPIPKKTVSKNSNLSLNISAVDFDNDTTKFSVNHSGISLIKISDSLAAASWKPTNRDIGDNIINFTVSDGFLADSKIANITVNGIGNTPPSISSSPETLGEVNQRYFYDAEALDPDDDELVFSLSANTSGVSIASSTGLISFVPSKSGLFAINVSVTDFVDNASQSFNLTISEETGLRILNVDAKVDGKKSSNLVNKGKIRKDAWPGSRLELKIKVKNAFSKSADLEIGDIVVKALIEGVDDGDDLEEESRKFDLDAQDDKSVALRFLIPFEADEDTFDVAIEAEGEDENGVEHNAKFDTEIDVEKERHDLRFQSFALSPSAVNCVREVNAKYKIINVGQEHEANALLAIRNSDLGLDFAEKGILIDSEGGNKVVSKKSRLKLKNDIEHGNYEITANIYSSDGILQDSQKAELKVTECLQRSKEQGIVLLAAGDQQKKDTLAVRNSIIEDYPIQIKIKDIGSSVKLLLISTLAFTSFFLISGILLFARFNRI